MQEVSAYQNSFPLLLQLHITLLRLLFISTGFEKVMETPIVKRRFTSLLAPTELDSYRLSNSMGLKRSIPDSPSLEAGTELPSLNLVKGCSTDTTKVDEQGLKRNAQLSGKLRFKES